MSTYRCDMGWSDTGGFEHGCRNEATTQFGLASLCEPCADDHRAIAQKREQEQREMGL